MADVAAQAVVPGMAGLLELAAAAVQQPAGAGTADPSNGLLVAPDLAAFAR